jgi:ABC-type nitrate/sulfonate/bicarbonate transport system permease component
LIINSVQGASEVDEKANALEMAPAFVAIVLLALFGIVLVSVVTYLENRFYNW